MHRERNAVVLVDEEVVAVVVEVVLEVRRMG